MRLQLSLIFSCWRQADHIPVISRIQRFANHCMKLILLIYVTSHYVLWNEICCIFWKSDWSYFRSITPFTDKYFVVIITDRTESIGSVGCVNSSFTRLLVFFFWYDVWIKMNCSRSFFQTVSSRIKKMYFVRFPILTTITSISSLFSFNISLIRRTLRILTNSLRLICDLLHSHVTHRFPLQSVPIHSIVTGSLRNTFSCQITSHCSSYSTFRCELSCQVVVGSFSRIFDPLQNSTDDLLKWCRDFNIWLSRLALILTVQWLTHHNFSRWKTIPVSSLFNDRYGTILTQEEQLRVSLRASGLLRFDQSHGWEVFRRILLHSWSYCKIVAL